jgi:hypothetical protein
MKYELCAGIEGYDIEVIQKLPVHFGNNFATYGYNARLINRRDSENIGESYVE